jgi:aspartyl-tRNA(Asn)/glutamyl-tRNA(Gln) amidotransferase subunit C
VLRNTRIGVLVPGNLIGIDLALCYKNLMKLTREEVQRVAMLARLRLTPEDEERLTEQLDNILHYVEKLNQLDTSGIEPFTHAAHIANPMREDAITNEPNADALLANAPAQESHFFQVPKIIE